MTTQHAMHQGVLALQARLRHLSVLRRIAGKLEERDEMVAIEAEMDVLEMKIEHGRSRGAQDRGAA